MSERDSDGALPPSARGAPSRVAALRAVPVVVLVVAVAFQVRLGVASDVRFLGHVPARWLSEVESPPNPEASAVRVLPELARRVPPGSSVLLVTSVLVRIQYEFYFVPRRFQLLLDFPIELVETLAEDDEFRGWYARRLRGRVEERDQLWSPERYDTAVRDADFVVAFYFDETLPLVPELKRVAQAEGVTLYEVVR